MRAIRHRSARLAGSAGLLAALLLHPVRPGWGAEPRTPSLQGGWRINTDLTARLSKDQEGQQGQRGGSSGAGGAGGLHSPGLGGVGPIGGTDNKDIGLGERSPGRDRNDAEVRKEVLANLDSLTIVQQPGQVTITDLGGHARVLKTDGSKVRDQGPSGPAQLRASWDRDGSLVVEVKPDKGTRRTESYLVSNDGKHLYLTISAPSRFFEILRAYDPVPATPAGPASPAAPAQDPKPPGQRPRR